MPTRFLCLVFLGVFAPLLGLACTGLTKPIGPEPIASASASAAPSAAPHPTPSASAQGATPSVAVAESPLAVTTLTPGKGPQAKNGDTLRVHYVGTLLDGKQFDSSLDRKKPIDFSLGTGQVIKGWDQGVLGMRAGEKRKLVIPPSLAYGAPGRPGIPPNATLVFEVQLVAINPKGPPE